MNTQGWLRTIIAINYDEEKFLRHILDTMGKEFETEILILEIIKDNYLIIFDQYSLIIDKGLISKIKGPRGPYRLDRYILEAFMIQGFEFNKMRSQYIRYVFDMFFDYELKKRHN